MNAEIRSATVADVPALVPLVEQYWAFEDITHFDRAQVGRELSRALSDPALMSGWIAHENGEAGTSTRSGALAPDAKCSRIASTMM